MSRYQYGDHLTIPCVMDKRAVIAWLWRPRGAWRQIVGDEPVDMGLMRKQVDGKTFVYELGWVRADERLAADIIAHAEPIDRLAFFWWYDVDPPRFDKLPKVVKGAIEAEGEAAFASRTRCAYRSKARISAWRTGWRRAAERAGQFTFKHRRPARAISEDERSAS